MPKGGKREGAGRKAGVPNKLSSTVKDNVVAVFDQIGGIAQMAQWAQENPTPFYNIYSKLIPVEAKVEGAGDNGEHLVDITIKLIKPNGS